MVTIMSIEYPIGKNANQILEFYLNQSLNADLKNAPIGLSIRKSKVESLIIFGKNDRTLAYYFKTFPFGYYKIIGRISKDNPSELSSEESFKLLNSDRILLLEKDNLNQMKEFLLEHGKQDNIIYGESISLQPFNTIMKFHFGNNNTNKSFFVIIPNIDSGLIWNYRHTKNVVNQLNDQIPIVDMQNFMNQHISPEHLGQYNAWDFYYKPLSEYTLDEIYHSSDVLFFYKLSSFPPVSLDREALSETVLQYEKQQLDNLHFNGNETLGVFLRGTDYRITAWHQIPYDPFEAAAIVKQYMKHYNLSKVFLDTEDLDNYNTFKSIFGKDLIAIDRQRFTVDKRLPHANGKVKGFEGLKTGLDYLLESLIVSRCYGILSTVGSSTSVLKSFGKQYNKFFEINLSKNPNVPRIYPIIIENHNKNHVYFEDADYSLNDTPLAIIRSNEISATNAGCQSGFTIESQDLFLTPGKQYVCSITSTDVDIIKNIKLTITGKNQEAIQITAKKPFSISKEKMHLSIQIKPFKTLQNTISIKVQIESGLFSTPYVKPLFSDNQLALKDDDGLYYKINCINSLNFKTGTMRFSDGTKKTLSLDERKRILNSVTYENGYTLFRIAGTRYISIELEPKSNESDILDYWALDEKITPMSRSTIKSSLKSILQYGPENMTDQVLDKCEDFSNDCDYCFAIGQILMEKQKTQLGLKWIRKTTALNRQYLLPAFDLLVKTNDSECLKEAYEICAQLSKSGNAGAMGRLARMYRDGKYVERDYDEAIKWMQAAAEKKLAWAPAELFDLLWTIDTPESDAHMIKAINKYGDETDYAIIGRLALAYFEGRGVKKNVAKSLTLMETACAKNNYWDKDYCRLVIKSQASDRYSQLLEKTNRLITTGHSIGLLYLGIMYRDGLGVPIDLKESRSLLERAVYKNIPNATHELEVCVNMINNS